MVKASFSWASVRIRFLWRSTKKDFKLAMACSILTRILEIILLYSLAVSSNGWCFEFLKGMKMFSQPMCLSMPIKPESTQTVNQEKPIPENTALKIVKSCTLPAYMGLIKRMRLR